MSPDTDCPSTELLRRSLDPDDSLPEPERQRIAEHVDHCEQGCKQTIDALLRANTVGGLDSTLFGRGPESTASDEAVPEVPGYEILGELGRGGMGVVYRARQGVLSRVVALKMLLGPANESEVAEHTRFTREALAIASLNHSGIVQIYELGQHRDRPFIAMELVEGGNLADKLGGVPQSARQAATLVARLADAVDAAHRQQIIHRDLKPANILLAADGTPKITDFGLARRLDAEPTDSVGKFLGTASYAAPEQALGRVQEVSPATDVYGLGAILYEMLTGRPPFRAATLWETLQQVVVRDPVPPSGLVVVPRDLETICLKCLQKEPGKRYTTARELADDLGRFLRGEPVQARPVGRWERGWRWCQRNRAVAGLLAGIGMLLLLVAAISTILGKLAWDKAVEAEGKAAEATRETSRARNAEEGQKKQRKRAEDLLYVDRLALAQRYWQEGNVRVAQDKLEEARDHQDTWEYRYLYTLMNHLGQRTFLGHTGSVTSVCFSPDGKRIASGSGDNRGDNPGEVKVWDAATGQEILSLNGHTSTVTSVCFSPDGERIISGSQDKTVKVWDAATGQEALSLRGHTGTVTSVCFSPDDKWIASGSHDKTVKVWEVETGQEALSLDRHTGYVTSVCFSPDGKRIASGSWDMTVKVWDATTGQEALSLKGHTHFVSSVCFSPDGKRIASSSWDRTVKVWDAATGKESLTFKGHTSYVHSVAFSPDGKRITSASDDKTVKVWDAATGQEAFSFKGHTEPVSSVCFSPDGKRIASGSTDQTVKEWDAAMGQEPLSFRGHTAGVTSVCSSPDGKRIASGSEDNTLKVWDAATGQHAFTLRLNVGSFASVCFSPDGKRIASGSGDNTVKVWDAQAGQEPLSLKGHTNTVTGVCFSPDGKWIASGSEDSTVRVWDAATGQEALSLNGHMGIVRSVCFSPDGKRIAAGGGDFQGNKPGEVKVWAVETGQEALSIEGHTNAVASVCFSPDGKWIASGSYDRTVKVWDAATGEEALSLKGHPSIVTSVCFSHDSKRIVSGSYDNTVKVWDAAMRQEALTLKGHTGGITSLCFSPEGERIASGSKDGTVKVWDAAMRQEALTLKGHTSNVKSVCFSPDGKRLASGSSDWTVRVWDAATGQESRSLKGHTHFVSSVCFSPDGKQIASGSWDRTVKVWDATTGEEALSLKGHTAEVTSVCFSSDGKRLLSRDNTRKQIAWDVATGQPLADAPKQVVAASPRSPDGRFFALADEDVIRIHRLPTGKEAEQAGYRWWVDPDYRWHASVAEQAWRDGDWFAAAFHLGRLLHELPWDATLHVRRSYALTRLKRTPEAGTCFLQALLLDPHVSPWPLAPEARRRGQIAAERSDWLHAIADLELAVHQPTAAFDDWSNLLLARAAVGRADAARRVCRGMIDRFENDARSKFSMVLNARTLPSSNENADRLVEVAQRLVAGGRDASSMDLLGGTLYRAGRYEEAVRTLKESITLHGKGGYTDTWVFLALAQQRLGKEDEARRNLTRFETWLAGTTFTFWAERTRWKLLHEEARALILKMPRAGE